MNVYNYQSFVETDKAGYIIRQWVASSLYDRIRCVRLCFCASVLLTPFQYAPISQLC